MSPSLQTWSLSVEMTWHIQGHLLSNKVKVSTQMYLIPRCTLPLCPEAKPHSGDSRAELEAKLRKGDRLGEACWSQHEKQEDKWRVCRR